MSKLTDLIRSKYPGSYDDMDDATLEKSVLEKYPEYKDLAEPEVKVAPTTKPTTPKLNIPPEDAGESYLGGVMRRFIHGPSEAEVGGRNIQGPEMGLGEKAASYVKAPFDWLANQIDNPMRAEDRGFIRPFIAGEVGAIGDLIAGGFDARVAIPQMPKIAAAVERINPEVENVLRNAPYGEGSIMPSEVLPTELRNAIPDIPPSDLNYRIDTTPFPIADRPDLVPVGEESAFNTPRRLNTPAKTGEEIIYENAKRKFNMGKSTDVGFNPDELTGLEKTPAEELPSIFQDVNKLADNPNRRSFAFDQSGELPAQPKNPEFESMRKRAGPSLSDLKAKQETQSRLMSETGEMKLTPEKQLEQNNNIGKFANESQKKSLWHEVRDANRAILTAFDFSAAGRQGKPLMMTKAYWNSFDDMFKSWGSQKAYDNVMESIHEKPAFKSSTVNGKTVKSLADRAGLDISGKEEMFNSSIADKLIPGVKRSERAYTAFLSKLRADHFGTMVEDARKMGMNPDKNDVILKQIGSFINDATGRGSLGKLEKAAPILNEVFFAPKLMASRVNMYKRWLDPRSYGNANPVVRKQVLKSLLSTVGFGLTVGELARLGGAQVSDDPNSSDFRKIRLGNTRIDPFSGFQQYAVGASRLVSGKLTSSKTGKEFDLTSGKFGMPTRASVASQFMQNKLAPVPSLVWSWMEGKDWDGQPFDVKKAMLDRTVPIVMQDLYELSQEDPKILNGVNPMVLGILPIMGEGVQTYGR